VRFVRAASFVVALAALAAAGAAVALVLLSMIGGAPERDPVGRLTPVLPGLRVATVTFPAPDTAGTIDTIDTTDDHESPAPTGSDDDGADD
jgi:hypothetical protein